MDEKTFWKNKNWDETEVHDLLKISNADIERRYKISTAHQLKWNTDPEYVQLKADAARKTAEIRRVIPVEDYKEILLGFYSATGRTANYISNMAQKYSVGISAIERIVYNLDDHVMPREQYDALRDAYFAKHPVSATRSDSLKKAHAAMTDEQRAQKDLNIQIAKDPVDADTAVAIYEECKYNRRDVHYKAAAAKHLTKTGKKIPWQKARDITNGYHYATQNFDIDADVKEYRLRRFGTFKFTSPEGKVFHFEDEKSCGAWMQKMDKSITQPDPYRVCTSMFDKTEANTPYVMRRRFFKGWTIENIKKVDF